MSQSEQRKANVVAIGLNERNKFSGQPPKAKIKNFRPSMIEGRLELSSFCMDELQEHEKWQVLDANSNKAPIPARSDLNEPIVLEAGLTCDPDWDPERHVNIIDWPSEDDRQTSAAQALYAAQAFFPRPAG